MRNGANIGVHSLLILKLFRDSQSHRQVTGLSTNTAFLILFLHFPHLRMQIIMLHILLSRLVCCYCIGICICAISHWTCFSLILSHSFLHSCYVRLIHAPSIVLHSFEFEWAYGTHLSLSEHTPLIRVWVSIRHSFEFKWAYATHSSLSEHTPLTRV